MLRIILFSTVFISSCDTLERGGVRDFSPVYISIDGTALWFENPGTPEMVPCSGHTCISVGQSFCDDEEYYCVDHSLLKIKIPKNLEELLPNYVANNFGSENVWIEDGYKYEVTPFSQGRIIPNYSRYKSEVSVFGVSRTIYQISTYIEGSDTGVSSVLYSPDYGIVAIQVFYTDSQRSFWLKGNCGYLAKVGCVETHR